MKCILRSRFSVLLIVVLLSQIGRAQNAKPEARAESQRDPSSVLVEGIPVCVVNSKARLRANPSTNAKINWTVGQFMPLVRVQSKNGWSQVKDLRGQTHWVINKALSTTETCAVVKARTTNLYINSDLNAQKYDIKIADRYSSYRRLDRQGEWVKLEDSFKGIFWVQDSSLWYPVRKSKVDF